MRHVVTVLALVVALGTSPVIAKEKVTDHTSGKSSSATSNENANREQNEDGTFQGKPVVQGPANWKSVLAEGATTGESGSSMSIPK